MNDTYTGILIHRTCGQCGVHFGMDEEFYNARLRDKKVWYCPNGCAREFTSETEEEWLRRQLQQSEARLASTREDLKFVREQRNKEERRVRAYRGVVGRIKKRVGNGVCPCCNRTFADLQRHMNNKHPRFKGKPEAKR